MPISSNIVTPANTPISSPLQTKVKINPGVIVHWHAHFPAGVEGELRLRVTQGSTALLPENHDGYITGDDFNYSFPDFRHIYDEPFVLDVYTWNIDVVNEHKIQLIITMVPLWTLYPFSMQFGEAMKKDDLLRL